MVRRIAPPLSRLIIVVYGSRPFPAAPRFGRPTSLHRSDRPGGSGAQMLLAEAAGDLFSAL